MKRAAIAVSLLAFVVVAIGCSGQSFGTSPESLTKQLIALLEDTADTLSKVHDEGSARVAAGKIQKLVQQRNLLQNQLDRAKQADISPEESRRLQQKYGPRLAASMQRVIQERSRLQSIPGAWSALSSQVAQITGGSGSRGMSPGVAGSRSLSAGIPGVRYGLTVLVEDVPGNVTAELFNRICAITKMKEAKHWKSSYGLTGTTFHMTCTSNADLHGVAAQVDFGTVIETDPAQGLIRVKADPSRLPTPLAEPVTDPTDPNFYQQNYQDLMCFDDGRAKEAATRLAAAEPRELRKEIAMAAQRVIKPGHAAGVPAIEVLVRYSDDDIVPILIELLGSEAPWVPEKAAEFLVERAEDPRAVEALAGLVVAKPSLAKSLLPQVGVAGQHAIAAYFHHEDKSVRLLAIQIGAEVGNSELVPALVEVFDDPDRRTRREAVTLVGKMKDQQAISPLCKLLMLEDDRGTAIDALREMGPMVEDTVLKGLKHSDSEVVYACCSVLQEVGTQKSLPALKPLTQGRNYRVISGATGAIRGIEARVR